METHYSTPTLGRYADLLNKPLSTSLNKINEELFTKLGQLYLERFGFFTVIYRFQNRKIWLKVYYFKSLIEYNKREVEAFINQMYACEFPELQYDECNMIHLPVKASRDVKALKKLETSAETEDYLQGIMSPNDYISYNPTTREGGTTWGSSEPNHNDYLRWQRMLFEGFLEPGYEDSLDELTTSPYQANYNCTAHKICFQNPKYKLSMGDGYFMISWETLLKYEHIDIPIKFQWKGVDFQMTIYSEITGRSFHCAAEIHYFDIQARCGIGMSTLGGGYIGKHPDIRIGRHQLIFSFGKTHVHLSFRELDFAMHDDTKAVPTDFTFFL